MTAERQPNYVLAAFRDPEAELERLRAQVALLTQREHAALARAGMPNSGRVLDVGSGPGFFAAALQAALPRLEIVAVDRDERCVEQASRHVRAVVADAEAGLPFAADHFDAVCARLVFRHLRQPELALAEMCRVVRPSGIVIVSDSDDGALVLGPSPDGFERALAARQLGARRRGADPLIGRRLPAMFRSAGLESITLEGLVVDSVSVGTRAFAKVVLSPITDAIDPDLLAPSEVEAAARAVEAWAEYEGAFGMTTALIVAGRKQG